MAQTPTGLLVDLSEATPTVSEHLLARAHAFLKHDKLFQAQVMPCTRWHSDSMQLLCKQTLQL